MTDADHHVTYRRVLGVREFRLLWQAHVLSTAGDQLARVAITLLVFARTGSAAAYAVTFLPDLVGGALSVVADRFDRRMVMIVADVLRAALVMLMVVPGVPLLAQVGLLFVVPTRRRSGRTRWPWAG